MPGACEYIGRFWEACVFEGVLPEGMNLGRPFAVSGVDPLHLSGPLGHMRCDKLFWLPAPLKITALYLCPRVSGSCYRLVRVGIREKGEESCLQESKVHRLLCIRV